MGASLQEVSKQQMNQEVNELNPKQDLENRNQIQSNQLKQNIPFQFTISKESTYLDALRQLQAKYMKANCQIRNSIVRQMIQLNSKPFYQSEQAKYEIKQLILSFQEVCINPYINVHQQTCFNCSGRYWEVDQWTTQPNNLEIQQNNSRKHIKFSLSGENAVDHLQVNIYQYKGAGNAYRKADIVRNMKIYKKPLSQSQLTDLIFNHQYLVVQCQNSYWSFEKDTKRLIIQSSVSLFDVRDKVMGERRFQSNGFTWFGIKKQWHPQIMYETNEILVKDIRQVRDLSQHLQQKSLNYNVFKANCKVYAQYILRNSITQKTWNQISTFWDFFH